MAGENLAQVVHRGSPSLRVSKEGVSRSLASALLNWLLTVPGLIPSRVAVSASERSS